MSVLTWTTRVIILFIHCCVLLQALQNIDIKDHEDSIQRSMSGENSMPLVLTSTHIYTNDINKFCHQEVEDSLFPNYTENFKGFYASLFFMHVIVGQFLFLHGRGNVPNPYSSPVPPPLVEDLFLSFELLNQYISCSIASI